jgi:putative endonuclease
METTKEKGNIGEDIACTFLVENGYSIIERNWHFSKYEVDIIAKMDKMIVFVEVKYRTGSYFGEPEIFVSQKQKSNLIRVANFYIDRMNLYEEARFDIIAIVKSNEKFTINHIEDAFKPDVNQD